MEVDIEIKGMPKYPGEEDTLNLVGAIVETLIKTNGIPPYFLTKAFESAPEMADEHVTFPVCSSCGQSCETKDVEAGYGGTEFQGKPGYDSNIQPASTCCGADVYETADDEGSS